MKSIINTTEAPEAIGPYSQAVKIGQCVYLSGQIPLVPQTMVLVSMDFRDQALQVFTNLKKVCEAAHGGLADIVKLTIYLTDLAHFAVVNEVMLQFFHEPYPARATIQVAALPKAALIEVDAIMVIDQGTRDT
jgi:reactive intermediate/imine deaminase